MKAYFLALALAIAPAVPAFCGNVTADNPIAIAELMKTFGYRAELTADDQGDPKIKSSAGGANFSVYFYGCTKNKDCTSIQFSAGFDLSDGTTMDVVNDWNANKRYGKVYLDSEKDPYIELDVNLDLGGVTEENLRDTLEIWDRLVSDFKTHIDW